MKSNIEAPLVYIIVLNYNNSSDTEECLESIRNLEYHNYKIVLIDNASTDHSREHLDRYLSDTSVHWGKEEKNNFNSALEISPRKSFEKLTFFSSPSNRGYAVGNNLGLTYALNDPLLKYAWVLNNDTIVDPESLSYLVADFEAKKADRNLGLLGSKLVFYYARNTIQCVGGKYRSLLGFPKQLGLGLDVELPVSINESEFDYVSGAAVLVSRELLTEVGIMNEAYFLYFEELDWAYRAKKKSFTLGYCDKSVVYHKDGASTKINTKSILSSPFSDYHFTKSKIIFSRLYFRKRLALVYFSFLIVILNRIKRGQWRNIGAIWRAILQK